MEHYDPDARDYAALMQKVKASGADAVVFAAILEENGVQLIRDKVAALGPNDGAVKLLAFDGFAQQATIDNTGPDAKGMYVSLPGKVPGALTGAGDVFVKELKSQIGDQPVEVFAPYAGQAAGVLIDAIQAGQHPRRHDLRALQDRRSRTASPAASRSPQRRPAPRRSACSARPTLRLARRPPPQLVAPRAGTILGQAELPPRATADRHPEGLRPRTSRDCLPGHRRTRMRTRTERHVSASQTAAPGRLRHCASRAPEGSGSTRELAQHWMRLG